MADRSAAPPPTLRARNKARTTAAILDAARRCIVEAGIQAATMDQIAAAADVSRATLFNYFASKSDIVDALIEQNEAGFFVAIAAWRRAGGLTVGERLLGLFAATAHYLRRASPIESLLVGASWLAWNDPIGTTRVARVVAAFAGLLEDGRDRGEIAAGIDLAAATEIVCNTYLGVVHAWRMDPAYPIARRMDAAARLLAGMVSPGAELPDRAPLPPT